MATGTFIFTFEGKSFPKYISVYRNKLEVKTYIKPVILCFKCFRFNHSKNVCRGKERCEKCGNNDHPKEHCAIKEDLCLYCGGDHLITDRKKTSNLIKRGLVTAALSNPNSPNFELADEKGSNGSRSGGLGDSDMETF
ncbi:unnamed protein product [Phaedon cochleariae]|uniref:Nucleic-acid-binding protein from mobile element jockey n=1 Tax=Phaedon cochleariae TaxID=80249 RepID=A0A9N9X496_PHACE|nr:unnamed protein product [Phaedon cochleariae]